MSNYIGCKISLISKAGIRYEGILYTIDPKESTVALSKVKSFGTEDRKVERAISARDEIYEYIIFRGSDIADLNVCEPNKEMTLLNEDSAIVRAESCKNVAHGVIPNLKENDTWINSNCNTKSPKPMNKPENEFSHNTICSPTSIRNAKPTDSKKPNRRMENYKHEYNAHDAKPDRNKLKPDKFAKSYDKFSQNFYDYEYANETSYKYQGYRGDYGDQEFYYQPKAKQIGGGRYRRGNSDYRAYYGGGDGGKLRGFESSELSGAVPYHHNQQNQHHNQQNQHHNQQHHNQQHYNLQYHNQQHHNQDPKSAVASGGRHHNTVPRGARRRPTSSSNKQTPPVNASAKETVAFKEDYDFETANAIIAKELESLVLGQPEKKDGNEDTPNEEGDVSDSGNTEAIGFYDKSKSFFDNISSEVTDRANGKTVRPMNRKEERKMNVETFGVAESRHQRGSGRLGGPRHNHRGWAGWAGRQRGAHPKSASGTAGVVGSSRRLVAPVGGF